MQGLIGWPLQKPIKQPNGNTTANLRRNAPLANSELALAN